MIWVTPTHTVKAMKMKSARSKMQELLDLQGSISLGVLDLWSNIILDWLTL
jgi:hypothetical protein